MAKRIILLSGPVSAGKSTLADALVERFDALVLRTRDVIVATARGVLASERAALQLHGEKLDRKTDGAWVAAALTRFAESLPADAIIVVDSVRIIKQVHAVRRAYGSRVVHVHLSADLSVLAQRYKHKQRQTKFREFGSYAELSVNRTERHVGRLAKSADVVIETDRSSKADVMVRAASRLGLYGKENRQLVDVLVGGAYGSEGKGHIASYLAPEYDILMRVGGPNAGHKVFEDPKPYVHHLLPSGTRKCDAELMIAPGAVLDVPQLLKEIAECNVSANRLTIDPHAMIIEKQDQEFEASTLVGSIGSTGQGVGAATARKIMRGATTPPVRLAKDVPEIRPFVHETGCRLEKAFREGQRVFLEGTQGFGLSLHHGKYPHVTSRDTAVAGCLSEAGIPPCRVRRVVMVCRTLPIRVKSPSKKYSSGPMAQPLRWRDVAARSGYGAQELMKAEHTSTTNRLRRVGEFEWDLFRRAVSLNGPTDVALSFVDYISRSNASARRFEQLTGETIRFIEELERVACAPVSLISTRFNYRSIIDRRSW
ncbi:MAG: adenylosuccinate synthetase [Bryobacteraceae bacterium]|nr:adenylosuccinate synthetase [Bryobacteraceae bacterium]